MFFVIGLLFTQQITHSSQMLKINLDRFFLRSTKEERFLISWATCDRVGVLCTQAKADPCFFAVHLFSAILNDVTISLRNQKTIFPL